MPELSTALILKPLRLKGQEGIGEKGKRKQTKKTPQTEASHDFLLWAFGFWTTLSQTPLTAPPPPQHRQSADRDWMRTWGDHKQPVGTGAREKKPANQKDLWWVLAQGQKSFIKEHLWAMEQSLQWWNFNNSLNILYRGLSLFLWLCQVASPVSYNLTSPFCAFRSCSPIWQKSFWPSLHFPPLSSRSGFLSAPVNLNALNKLAYARQPHNGMPDTRCTRYEQKVDVHTHTHTLVTAFKSSLFYRLNACPY